MNEDDIHSFNSQVENTTRRRQIMELNMLEQTSINEHISVTKLCLIGGKVN